MSDMTDREYERQIEEKSEWGAEEKRLRAIRNTRRAEFKCIYCGKPLGFWDKRAKRDQHPRCEKFVE